MRRLFAIATICLIPVVLAAVDYKASIRALVFNQIEPVDNSRGEINFDSSEYDLAELGFDDLADYGYYSYGSYNYLTKLVGLARIAKQENLYGDLVFLIYKFVYAGNHENTDINTNSSMMLDLAARLDKTASKRVRSNLLNTLIDSSSVSELADVFMTAESLSHMEESSVEKRWDLICGHAHEAGKDACRALANAVEKDSSWTTGGPRHREYGGCFVSWSSDTSLHIHDLYSPMSNCLSACGSSSISCRIRSVNIGGKNINVCVSNRHNGCR